MARATTPSTSIALQETKLADEQFPRAQIEALGLHAVSFGQKTYNGVAILSRPEAKDVATGTPSDADPQRRVIAATIGPVRLVNVYVPNGQAVGSDKYAYKLAWLERAARLPRGAAEGPRAPARRSATSISRRRTATCTTRPPGRARSS